MEQKRLNIDVQDGQNLILDQEREELLVGCSFYGEFRTIFMHVPQTKKIRSNKIFSRKAAKSAKEEWNESTNFLAIFAALREEIRKRTNRLWIFSALQILDSSAKILLPQGF